MPSVCHIACSFAFMGRNPHVIRVLVSGNRGVDVGCGNRKAQLDSGDLISVSSSPFEVAKQKVPSISFLWDVQPQFLSVPSLRSGRGGQVGDNSPNRSSTTQETTHLTPHSRKLQICSRCLRSNIITLVVGCVSHAQVKVSGHSARWRERTSRTAKVGEPIRPLIPFGSRRQPSKKSK